MRGPTHVLGGVALAALLPHTNLATMALAGIGALLPDLDHPRSALGRMMPGSGVFYWTVGHRTVTHSALALAILWAATTRLPVPVHVGLAVGFGSHLLLDALSGGVPLVWPLGYRFRLPSVPEWLAVPVLVAATVWAWKGGGLV